jgi:hypothetical protein
VGGVSRSTALAIGQVGAALNESATAGEAGFTRGLQAHTEVVTRRADQLANALSTARAAAVGGAPSGMEAIARAYESWLGSGGLATILDSINGALLRGPTTGPAALRSLPGAVVGQTAAERPRATIEIQEVVIELAPRPAPDSEPPSPPIHSSMIDQVIEELEELFQRGYRPGQGFAQAFA